jgi:hypothetical protein
LITPPAAAFDDGDLRIIFAPLADLLDSLTGRSAFCARVASFVCDFFVKVADRHRNASRQYEQARGLERLDAACSRSTRQEVFLQLLRADGARQHPNAFVVRFLFGLCQRSPDRQPPVFHLIRAHGGLSVIEKFFPVDSFFVTFPQPLPALADFFAEVPEQAPDLIARMMSFIFDSPAATPLYDVSKCSQSPTVSS